jgi:hypothetical protein
MILTGKRKLHLLMFIYLNDTVSAAYDSYIG